MRRGSGPVADEPSGLKGCSAYPRRPAAPCHAGELARCRDLAVQVAEGGRRREGELRPAAEPHVARVDRLEGELGAAGEPESP